MTRNQLVRIRSRWRRLALSLFLSCLVLISKLHSRRARVHWAGHQRRARRLERLFIGFVLFGGFIFLETEQYLLWSTVFGGLASVFVIIQSVRMFMASEIGYDE